MASAAVTLPNERMPAVPDCVLNVLPASAPELPIVSVPPLTIVSPARITI